MPFWNIYYPPNTFTTPESKKALAKDITDLYSPFIPRFYVVVVFVPVEPGNFYISGVERPCDGDNEHGPDSSVPFIRITIENLARTLPDKAAKDRFTSAVDRTLKPHIAGKGYDWEYSVNEADRDLWKINGFIPPLPETEGENLWRAENKPISYPGMTPTGAEKPSL